MNSKRPLRLGVVGGGYVGLVTASCLADLGFHVQLVEANPEKARLISDGICPFFEPGLNELLQSGLKQGRLTVQSDLKKLADVSPEGLFLAVGTPSHSETGRCDTSALDQVVEDVMGMFKSEVFLILKSTVPIGTASRLSEKIRQRKRGERFFVINNPEFLREGSAIQDFLRPDRVVVGTRQENSIQFMKRIYEPLLRNGHPMFVMTHESAELSKYAANLMLASRISTVNQVARLSEACGADIKDIEKVLRTDHRIGSHYLYAGLGYGGSCFPKDVLEFIYACQDRAIDSTLAESIHHLNASQQLAFLPQIQSQIPKGGSLGVLGLSFKPLTDDVRGAASVNLLPKLIELGYHVRCHDPKATSTFLEAIPSSMRPKVQIFTTASEALRGASALLLLTEWHEYRILEPQEVREWMSGRVVFDGRNIFDPTQWQTAGFSYFGVGRGNRT